MPASIPYHFRSTAGLRSRPALLRLASLSLALAASCCAATEAPATLPICHAATVTGEVQAGEAFVQSIGAGLELYLQPIASGWILRVVPRADPFLPLDYAELATPPYRSVNPLSLSTDFSFRAQDAIGWNPRRFRFAPSAAVYERLLTLYRQLPVSPTARPDAAVTSALAGALPATASATLRLLDARLIAGTADQQPAAAAVASHFNTTAHTLDLTAVPTPLGRILGIRFAIDLELPAAFPPDPSLHSHPMACPTL